MKKRITAAVLGVLVLCSSAFAAKTVYTKGDMIESVGNMISNYGVYGDFDAEDIYLQTLSRMVEVHPEFYTEVMKSLVSCKDKYGQYYTAEEGKKILESLSDSITGIGVTITRLDENLIITQVINKSPAQSAGLLEGDIITAVNGESVKGLDLDSATALIKGEIGTSVSVTVSRSGVELTFKLTRAEISTDPIEYEILENDIGYIRISTFSENLTKYFSEAMTAFARKNIKDIIIDVRNNGGGYLDEAVSIADWFLPSGKIITSEDHKIDLFDTSYIAKGPKTDYNTVVLINGNSASASEVLTAALVENGAAISIGENSYGKGTVQSILSLPDGGMMKYTTAFYLTPSGKNIEGKGISPNIYVENQEESVDLSQFSDFKYKNTYKIGMTDPEIKTAKEMLRYLGIYYGEINEYFDENLRITVSALQKAKDRDVTGVLDPTAQLDILQTLCDAKITVDSQLDEAIDYLLELRAE